MTLIQLQYFSEVVQVKNFTKAAEALHVSQSTLSKSIRALESEFQVELIDRNSKEFRLTEEGKLFCEYAQRILNYYNMQISELRQRISGRDSVLRVGIPPTAGTAHFNRIVHRFQAEYPEGDLRIADSMAAKQILEMLEEGKLDVGVLLGEFNHPDYRTCIAYTSEVKLVVSAQHRLANRESVSFVELKDEKFLMFSPEYMFHDVVLGHCATAGFVPNVVMYSYQWDLIYDLTAANKGVSFLPEDLVAGKKEGEVRLIHLTDPEFPWLLPVVYRRDKYLTTAMRRFLRICREERDLLQ